METIATIEPQENARNARAIFLGDLPHKPYCTNHLQRYGLQVRPKATAIRRRYVQHNPPSQIRWLVTDIDRPTAGGAWMDAGLPEPAWVARGDNGHAHIAYGLVEPVCRTDFGRGHPMQYAAAVERGLRIVMDGDPAYSGLTTKNPLHNEWFVYWGRGGLYELGELAEYVPLNPPREKREVTAGIGRNCAVFDAARHWAYGAIRGYWHGDYRAWYGAVLDACDACNAFDQNLPRWEVAGIARSIARWTWRNFRAGHERFRAKQAERGRRSGQVRSPGSEARERPWETLGISRATYYRRKVEKREYRRGK